MKSEWLPLVTFYWLLMAAGVVAITWIVYAADASAFVSVGLSAAWGFVTADARPDRKVRA